MYRETWDLVDISKQYYEGGVVVTNYTLERGGKTITLDAEAFREFTTTHYIFNTYFYKSVLNKF